MLTGRHPRWTLVPGATWIMGTASARPAPARAPGRRPTHRPGPGGRPPDRSRSPPAGSRGPTVDGTPPAWPQPRSRRWPRRPASWRATPVRHRPTGRPHRSARTREARSWRAIRQARQLRLGALMSAVKGSGNLLGSLEASERPKESVAHERGRNLKDVGDQALMRGLATAFPRMRPGCPCLTAGVGALSRPPSVCRAFPCRGSIPTHARRLGGSPRVRSCWPQAPARPAVIAHAWSPRR